TLAEQRVFPSEMGIDVAVLAAMVHAADTRISRSSDSQDTWTRELRLVVPVSEPIPWSDAAPHIQRMLEFLTGDRWSLGFRQRPDRFRNLTLMRPENGPIDPPFDSLSLFSGGVDSLVGGIDLLAAGRTPLFI